VGQNFRNRQPIFPRSPFLAKFRLADHPPGIVLAAWQPVQIEWLSGPIGGMRLHLLRGQNSREQASALISEMVQFNPNESSQDWLRLLSKADRPAMTGAMNFRVQILVRPGEARFH
jgi:hypothetical protein